MVLRRTVRGSTCSCKLGRGVMEILEAVHALHDVHLRDKCERAITAVQRTIDLYGCVLPEDSIPGGFEASATLLE